MLALALLAGSAAWAQAPAGGDKAPLDRFEQQAESVRGRLKILGLSVAIVKNRELLWTKGFSTDFKDDAVRIKHLLSHTSSGTPGERFQYSGPRYDYLTGGVQSLETEAIVWNSADDSMTYFTYYDVGYVTDRAQKVAQADLAALVPGARHVTKTDSGHNIHRDNPALVTEAIREVVDAVRAGKTALP